MNEPRPQDAEQEPAAVPYLRLPVPLLATGLLVFLAALLGLGLWANANLRSPRSVTPAAEAPTAVVSVAATQGAPAAATDVVVATGTPVPLPVVQPTPTGVLAAPIASTATVAATATYAPAPLVIVLEASATATPLVVQTQTPTPMPTVEPTLAAEVSKAYEHYWQVRAEALYQLDTSHLDEVMGGEHLAAVEGLIAQLHDEDHAILTDVSHNYAILQASSDTAEIADEYTDNSIYVDATSRSELSKPIGGTVREQYEMANIDGGWKVVRLVRAQ